MNDIDVSNYEYGNDVNTFAESISDAIYECVRENRDLGMVHIAGDAVANLVRWNRLLQDRDDKRVWQAINWKRCLHVNDTYTDVKPSDEDFKCFYYNIINFP